MYSDKQIKDCIDALKNPNASHSTEAIPPEHIKIIKTAWQFIEKAPHCTIDDLKRAGLTFHSIDSILGGINRFKKLIGHEQSVTDTQRLDYEELLLSIAKEMSLKGTRIIPNWKDLPNQRAIRKWFTSKDILCNEMNRLAKKHHIDVEEFLVGKGCTPAQKATVRLPPVLEYLPSPSNELELQPIAIEYLYSQGYKIQAINAIGIDFEVIEPVNEKKLAIELKMYSAGFDKRLDDVDGLLCLHDNMNASMKEQFIKSGKPVISLADWLNEL
ncbi:hypothetical protein MCT03_15870 [Vibrio aestuarianus]|nr:hypothetical protein [Vibrio aestuarianus]